MSDDDLIQKFMKSPTMGTILRQILKNQVAILEATKRLDWYIQTERGLPEDTWDHPANDRIKETKEILR